MRSVVALLFLCGALAPGSNGPIVSGPGANPAATPGATAVSPSDDRAPVPVPEPGEKAIRFYRSGNVLWCLRTLWEVAVPAAILFTGFSARIRDRAERIGRRWFFVVVIYLVTFMAVKYLLDWPLNCYQGFLRQHAYGLSRQSFGRWLGNSLKHLAVDTSGYVAFLWFPYLLMRKCPQRWWLHSWLAATAAALFVVLITPIWIDPWFNQFCPMKNKALEADILALAERAGIEGSRVFEVDQGADTKAVNAYVTGFMGTKRIVLWDTIIAKLNRRELLTVMGHEMGHYVLGHVAKGMLFGAALGFFGIYLFSRLSGRLIGRFQGRFGFDSVSNIASFPLILLFVSAGNLALDPLILAFSRHLEHEADRFGLEITRDNRAAANAFVKLQSENLGVPRPGLMYTLCRATHPSPGGRIDFANTYRPWAKGEPLSYEHLFKAARSDKVATP